MVISFSTLIHAYRKKRDKECTRCYRQLDGKYELVSNDVARKVANIQIDNGKKTVVRDWLVV